MAKYGLAVITLAVLAGQAMAQAGASGDEVNRRNTQIARHCTGIVQAKFNYAKFASAEKASQDRAHSNEIEACYRAHAISATLK